MAETAHVIDYDHIHDGSERWTVFRTGRNGQTYSAAYDPVKDLWRIRNLHSGHRIRPGGRIGTRVVNAAVDWSIENL